MQVSDARWGVARIGLHVVTLTLLVVVVVRALLLDEGPRGAIVLAATCVAAVYVAGLFLPLTRDLAVAVAWLVVLTVAWVWLLWLAPDAVYLAFPFFFLAAFLLPDRLAIAAVAALAAIAIAGYALHEGVSFGAALGPVLGGLFAISTVLGLRAVQRESERRGVLEERERLAREVHDTLAQGLGSINLLLGAASELLLKDPAQAAAADLVAQARRVAVDNHAEARRFVRALTPPALMGAPLVDAIQEVIDESSVAEFRISGVVRALPGSYDVAILRIVQEALTNALRHADAHHVAVTLSYLDDVVAVDVVDDGRGFTPGESSGGFGLSSMSSRARDLGGTLDIESRPGGGTAVALILPAPQGVSVGGGA